ncbi:MAG: hypothetical protein AB7S26_42740 [Sandaracinaceae bacterium]
MSAAPRKKRVWTVADFARHANLTHRPARRMLTRLNAKHGGRLLIPSAGANREYRFYPSTLARLEPDLFTPVESLEFRVEALEEELGAARADQKRIAAQVGKNTRDVAQLRFEWRAA